MPNREIAVRGGGHYCGAMQDAAGSERTANPAEPSCQPLVHSPLALSVSPTKRRVDAGWIRELVAEHHRFIWRLLARLGVRDSDLDDTVQQVFMVLVQRKDLELEAGSERSFLFGVALKVVRTYRRTLARRREANCPPPEQIDPGVSPEALAEKHRALSLLDEILESMPMDLRLPFVLFELDDMSTSAIAEMLGIPSGTVASRLRRAREWFERRVKRVQLSTLGGVQP
jgi:RNA polymerase sigma-70 factor, ECF subfamily